MRKHDHDAQETLRKVGEHPTRPQTVQADPVRRGPHDRAVSRESPGRRRDTERHTHGVCAQHSRTHCFKHEQDV